MDICFLPADTIVCRLFVFLSRQQIPKLEGG